MNSIHIDTQYKENYGTPEAPYWKYKGGSTYVITGFSHPLNDRIGAAAAAAVEAVRSQIEQSDDYSETHIIDWSLTNDELTQDEKMQLEYDGRIAFPSRRIAVA